MKQLILVLISITAINLFGQIDSLNNFSKKRLNKLDLKYIDSIPIVIYKNSKTYESKPAYFINGNFTNETIIKTINPQIIDSLKIKKGDLEIENKKYYGQIHIKLKNNYKPKIISLNDLKLKYTKIKDSATIFMIDNETINEDCRNYIVDENFILKIIVETIDNQDEKLKLNIIRLLTKTEENIKKSKQIWIRGEG